MKYFIMLLVLCLSFPAFAKCFNSGGVYRVRASLIQKKCPYKVPTDKMLGYFKFSPIPCGIILNSEKNVMDDCLLLVDTINIVKRREIGGFIVVKKLCKNYECNSLYLANFERVKHLPKPKQMVDKE